jgi:hypothetical protein
MVGLNKQYGKSIHDILASQQEDSVGSPHNPHILWRYRHPETSVPVRHCQVLADARSRIAEDAIINAENGYETVGAESVIILACDGMPIFLHAVPAGANFDQRLGTEWSMQTENT